MVKKCLAIVISLFFIFTIFPALAEAQVVDSVQFRIAGENLRQRDGMDLIVAGVPHNLTIELNAPTDYITVLAQSSSDFPAANMTNTYNWSYVDAEWDDNLYTYFINESESKRYGNTFCFSLGIINNATQGKWELTILVDGQKEWNESFFVEEPRASISFSGPNFYFNIEPYLTGFIDSYAPGDPANTSYFTTKNSGNVPLDFDISYDSYNNLFTTTNSSGLRHLGEEMIHYITFQAEKWSPRQFTVKGKIHGDPQMLVTPAMVSFILAPEAAFNVIVKVARPGFDIFQMNGLVVQYKSRLIAYYYDELQLDLYLTGTKNSHLSVVVEDLTLVGLLKNDLEISQPVSIQVSDETETHMVATVNCSDAPPRGQPSMLTYVKYTAETDDFLSSGEFTTTIVVKARTIADDDDDIGLGPINKTVLLFIGLALLVIIIFMLAYHQKTKEERVTEKKVKEKEEPDKKRGKTREYKGRRKKKWV